MKKVRKLNDINNLINPFMPVCVIKTLRANLDFQE